MQQDFTALLREFGLVRESQTPFLTPFAVPSVIPTCMASKLPCIPAPPSLRVPHHSRAAGCTWWDPIPEHWDLHLALSKTRTQLGLGKRAGACYRQLRLLSTQTASSPGPPLIVLIELNVPSALETLDQHARLQNPFLCSMWFLMTLQVSLLAWKIK